MQPDQTNIRGALLELHRRLLQAQRVEVERFGGRMTPGELLQAAAEDLRFSWLRELSQLLAEPELELDRAQELIAPPSAETAFGSRYLHFLQAFPEVVLAHRDATAALASASSATAAAL
jgi:hypothetical protein